MAKNSPNLFSLSRTHQMGRGGWQVEQKALLDVRVGQRCRNFPLLLLLHGSVHLLDLLHAQNRQPGADA
jgi:hypothetical protein